MSRTVLVFEEEAILAAAGTEGKSPRIRQVERVALKGYGDSFARWKEALIGLKSRMDISRAHLVLPATMCSTKMAQIPYARGRQLKEMAKREMEEAFRSPIMDYAVVEAERTGMMLCCGSVEEKTLAKFTEMLAELDVSVQGVTVPMEGYLNILKNVAQYRTETAVFLFFEEGGMTSVLMQEGQYRYSTRGKLFSERGTNDFGTEITRSISGILQFIAANKIDAKPTDVYYAGCSDADFEVSLAGLGAMGLKAHRIDAGRRVKFPDDVSASDYMSCVGAMMAGKGGISLRLAKTREGGSEALKTFISLAGAPAVVFLLCAVAAGIPMAARMELERENDKLVAWMNSDKVVQTYAKAVEIEEEDARLNEAVNALNYTELNLSTYPEVVQKTIDKIHRAGGMDIDIILHSYDSGSGVLNFEATSGRVIAIPDYVRDLKGTDLFHEVNYTGYAFNGSGEDGTYRLTLSCTLQGANVGGGEEK